MSPLLFQKFIERYAFKKLPENLATGSGTWSDGKFVFQEEEFDLSVQIHPDGIIADTRHSTDISDLFLHDCVRWMTQELGTNLPRVTKRMYKSEIVLYASRGLAGLCDKLDLVSTELSVSLNSPQELSAVFFGSSSTISALTFERRINFSFEENAFFSSALLQTSKHFELLGKIESLLEPDEPSEPPAVAEPLAVP